MSTNFLQILDEDSLIRLRGHATFSPLDLMDGVNAVAAFADLSLKLDLKLISSPYEFDASKILALPQAKSWSENNDRRNCDVIFQALPGLTPVEATDERIWVSLCFNQFNDYTNVRWPLKSDPTSSKNAKELTKSLLEHRFAGTARARWRNNSVSRLWWMAFYANSFEGLSATSALNVLCLDSDLVASFLGRPWTANNRVVAKYLIQELEKKYLNRDAPPFSRMKFRETLKEIDLRSGRLLVGSLNESDIESFVHKIFTDKHVEI
jgi:hypothetical protein